MKEASKVSGKKSVIVVFWSSKNNGPKHPISGIRFKYPEIKVRSVDVANDPTTLKKHAIHKLPTVVLLKNGREIDRIEGANRTLVEDLFRKATT